MTQSTPNPKKVEYITARKLAIIYGIDSKRVLKEYFEDNYCNIEFQVYNYLSSHLNIIRFLGH
ncbi:hypothetical protein P154DRAFT_423740 [Amniculicola lignicola CBS 123094]|uniref:Uncharacterized protein n=1 Tax=Amniculicola lignicola CBS 123094 TaxID=1392246 RepID=A0A6A5WY79_9PLEO|nr:hypothetical protein P154DRAFT_423740 [Amniculicola lignicola CBS 123094]